MPVEVSLLALLRVKDSRTAWPAEFAALLAKCEENYAERLPFGVTADWLDEHGEHDLGNAFRWLHARPTVRVTNSSGTRASLYYQLEGVPRLLGGTLTGECGHGFVGVMTALADRLAELKRDLA